MPLCQTEHLATTFQAALMDSDMEQVVPNRDVSCKCDLLISLYWLVSSWIPFEMF